jgi:hypothetical protein
MPLKRVLLIAAFAATPLAAQSDSTWRDHGAAAEAARRAGDWPAYRLHLQRADEILGAHPGVVIGLARAAARMGDTAAAFAQLRRFAAMGLTRDLAGDPDLASLHGTAGWREVEGLLRENAKPVDRSAVSFTIPDSGFVPEDLVWDGARRRWLVSSVRRGSVIAVGEFGAVSEYIPAGRDSAWAMLGMASDARWLWVASNALPHGPRAPADSGRAAILRYDLSTGRLVRRYELARGSAPGDLTVHDGIVYAGDGRTGAVYRLRPERDSVETLVPAGILRSAQQPVMAPNRRDLLVADYTRGIAVVNTASGAVRWLRPRPTMALTGIDGLAVYGQQIFAVQNGVTPHRVLSLGTNPELTEVVVAQVLVQDPDSIIEPTHAVVRGGYLWLIANSGWDALADDGSVKPGARLVPARVLQMSGDPSGWDYAEHTGTPLPPSGP